MKKCLFFHILINFLETHQIGRLEKVPFELENNNKKKTNDLSTINTKNALLNQLYVTRSVQHVILAIFQSALVSQI